MVAWKSLFSISRFSPARFICTCISAISALRLWIVSPKLWIDISRSPILAVRSCSSRVFFSVCNWFWLNSVVQKSFCLISSCFSCSNWAIMSSMAFFTRSKAFKRTLVASAASRGLCIFCATAARSCEAFSRRLECAVLSCCRSEGLKVLVKRSCASSLLSTEMASETACISCCRVLCRSSHSLSVIWHLSFSIIRNCSSADNEALVSSMSSLAWAFFTSVSASSSVFLSSCDCAAAISASLAAFSSS
mmetsp:Transcript_105823/g.257102  ORF Transcript_105823/g.257102 Transcript_105823/m.257102 type:complete len:248 (-) Transcript_105823:37-780(-)